MACIGKAAMGCNTGTLCQFFVLQGGNMIISASRRTDIPALYAEWFCNRIKEQYVLVRNPMRYHQVSRVNLAPEAVDGIVFWTKNAAPMLERLHLLQDYRYYFLFTINAYGPDIESNLPDKFSALTDTFRKLAGRIGPERVIWRYNPLFVNGKYTHGWHLEQFGKLADVLAGYTEKCILSFLDFYAKIRTSLKAHGIKVMPPEQKYALAADLAKIAFEYKLEVDMDKCGQDGLDFTPLCIKPACCIDAALIERLTGYPLKVKKDPGQPVDCRCVESIDIGAYSTCGNGCRYCYANSGLKVAPVHSGRYDVNSPLLCGSLEPADVIKERKVKSLCSVQRALEFFRD